MSKAAAALFVGFLLAVVVASSPAIVAEAGESTAGEIVEALKPKAGSQPLTRSIVGPRTSADDHGFIDNLRGKPTRSITVEERAKTAEIVKAKPSIDLEVTFDYDSANIGAKAMPTLVALGTALRNPDLKGQSFLVGGHTDASGGDAYNQNLSERRAEAVKSFLVEKFALSAENLIGIGFGKEQLKNKADPLADENRRVQVVNLSAQ